MTDEQKDDDGSSEKERPLTLWQLIASTLAAAFGVQSSANRKRDFSRGRPGQFIAMGIIFTVLFVVVMILLVNGVLSALT